MSEIHPYYLSWQKRTFDVAIASVLLVVLLPTMLFISLTVLVVSGWPVIFVQKRRGQYKKDFRMIKFRTMYVGAEKNQWRYRDQSVAPAPMYKNWHDPRFTKIGRWLSKSGLDELPQLINILKGEMSFVGPRPLPVNEAMQLGKNWDFRYEVKPGVFSRWSMTPNRNESLGKWRELEKSGLIEAGWLHDLSLIWKNLTRVY